MAPDRRRVCAVASVLLSAAAVDALPQQQIRRPDTPVATLAQGRAFLQANDLERARASVEAVLTSNPASAEAHYLLGMIAERQKDLAAAAAAYQMAIQYAPTKAEAHDRL